MAAVVPDRAPLDFRAVCQRARPPEGVPSSKIIELMGCGLCRDFAGKKAPLESAFDRLSV